MGENLPQKVAKGAIWTLLEKISVQLVGFVVGVVLARLLTPDDYGTVALTSVFFAIAGVLVDCGFGIALIQKKDADDLDFNSVFYLSAVLSLVIYVILFFSAPFIANFYRVPELVAIVRISALTFFFNSINSVQNAELMRKMLFNLSFRISIITTISSAVCGILMAYLGYGVWALVWSTLVSGFVGTVSRWFIIAWRPKLMFSFARLKPLFSYGWKMAASALLDRAVSQINGLLIGKFYTKVDLAFVNKGHSLPQLVMMQIDDTLSKVSFPAFVQLQNDKVRLRDGMRRLMICSTFLVFPAMVGVAVCSKTLILLLFGQKWLEAAPYMMLACFSLALRPFHTINIKGIMVLGRSDLFLIIGIVKDIAKITAILLSFRYGVFVFMAVCSFVLGPLSVLINAWPNKRLLNYTVRMQIMDVLPCLGLCAIEAAVVVGIEQGINMMGLNYYSTGSYFSLVLLLVLQMIGGLISYFTASYFFRVQPLRDFLRIISRTLEAKLPKVSEALERMMNEMAS